MTDPAEDFRARFQRLRDQRAPGVSLENLYFDGRDRLRARGCKAVSLSTVQKRTAPGAKLPATEELLVTLAAAVDVPPEEFIEYRLALARQQLDESGVGLERALANLDASPALDPATRLRAPEEIAEEAARLRESTPGEDARNAKRKPRKGRAA
jgi:hypothetical protein